MFKDDKVNTLLPSNEKVTEVSKPVPKSVDRDSAPLVATPNPEAATKLKEVEVAVSICPPLVCVTVFVPKPAVADS